MANTYFIGMRADADLVSNERPGSWREIILRLYPNGSMPLTALTAMMPSKKVTDAYYHWWQKAMPTQSAPVVGPTSSVGLYTDAACSATYSTGATAGQTLYCKITTANAKQFIRSQQVQLLDASDPTMHVVARITNVIPVDATYSALSCYLLEADDNSTAGTLAQCDTVTIIGTANPQGGTRPEAITSGPEQRNNYTQIFRNSLDLSRTLMETKLRTEPAYQAAKRDALEYHGIEMEKAFMWGIQGTGTGINGKPITYTEGIISSIRTYGLVDDFKADTDTAYAGKAWVDCGDRWLNENLEVMFRYGSSERLALCGSGALLGIQTLVQELGLWELLNETTFGINVTKWTTPFGTITFKTHPLFSVDATTRNMMVLIEPKNIEYNYITDTIFMPDTSYGKGGGTGKDGKEEEYLTEAGLEFHFPETGALFTSVGLDNTV